MDKKININSACDWYTQMMWNASEKFGIGIVQDCDTGEFLCRAYVVFRYTPAGESFIMNHDHL